VCKALTYIDSQLVEKHARTKVDVNSFFTECGRVGKEKALLLYFFFLIPCILPVRLV